MIDDKIKIVQKMGASEHKIELMKMVDWLDENGGAAAFTELVQMTISKCLSLKSHDIIDGIFEESNMDDQTIARIVNIPVNLVAAKRKNWEVRNGK